MDTTPDGSARYEAKRASGISPVRSDGSWCSGENDRQAAAAEEFAARSLGCEFNGTILADCGDGHCDFSIPGAPGKPPIRVDVKWLGGVYNPRPIAKAHLIVNPSDLERETVDVYVAVAGSIEQGFEIAGWIYREDLRKLPQMNFGFGFKYGVRATALRPLCELQERK